MPAKFENFFFVSSIFLKLDIPLVFIVLASFPLD